VVILLVLGGCGVEMKDVTSVPSNTLKGVMYSTWRVEEHQPNAIHARPRVPLNRRPEKLGETASVLTALRFDCGHQMNGGAWIQGEMASVI